MAKDDRPTRSRRGFAAMDPELRRTIAAKGGRAIPAGKRSFSADRELASKAGRKGGLKSRRSDHG